MSVHVKLFYKLVLII